MAQPLPWIFPEAFQLHTTHLGGHIYEWDNDWERSLRVYRDAGIPIRMNIRQHDLRLFRPLNGTDLLLHVTVMQTVPVPHGRRLPQLPLVMESAILSRICPRPILQNSSRPKKNHRSVLLSIIIDCRVEDLAARACHLHSRANCGTLFSLVGEQTSRGYCFVTVESRHWRCQTLSTMGCKDLQTVGELKPCLAMNALLIA